MRIDLAIKFGSNEIIIYRKGFGIISKCPAYLALVGNKIKAFGKQAEKIYLNNPTGIQVYRPIENSIIINQKMAITLLNSILKEVLPDLSATSKIHCLVAVPCAIDYEELLKIKSVLKSCGVSHITFVQNSVCARKTLDLDPNAKIMVVDIGKYITDVSVLNEYSFDYGKLYYIGGNDMDKCISAFIGDNYALSVSDMVSEQIKNEVASLYDRDSYKTEFIGVGDDNKIVKSTITASEVKVAITNVYDAIIAEVGKTIKSLPKELAIDIQNNGVMFVGGASTIPGFYEYAKSHLDLPIYVPEQPNNAVIYGAGQLLNSDKSFIKFNL